MTIRGARARCASTGSGPVMIIGSVVAALVLLLSACSSSPRPWTDRDTLAHHVEQTRGVPLVLPTTLPEAYVFLGPGFEERREGRVVVRAADFRLDDGPASGVVDVCAAEPGSPTDVCVAPGEEADTVERTVGAYPVWIRPLGTGALPAGARAFWTTVPLTADLDAVGWLT